MLSQFAFLAALVFASSSYANDQMSFSRSYHQNDPVISTNGDHYLLQVNLSDFDKSEINVVVERGFLKISASKKISVQPDSENSVFQRFYYSRKLPLHFNYNGTVRATFRDGILRIIVPILDKMKSNKQIIEVE